MSKIDETALGRAMGAYANHPSSSGCRPQAMRAAIEAYERAKAEQKPPERTTLGELERVLRQWIPHGDWPVASARILDVLSHPSSGVVEAIKEAYATAGGGCSDWLKAVWQAGVAAIKRGEG